MMFAAQALTYEVNKARLPYNVNSLSQKAAAFILERDGELREQIARIIEGRKWLISEMERLPGLHVYPSDANIILFRISGGDRNLFDGLKEEGILIRNLSRPGRLYNCYRVCVGTEEENRLFIEALRKRLIS
jgi:histidinol-phosphate aminotransferase